MFHQQLSGGLVEDSKHSIVVLNLYPTPDVARGRCVATVLDFDVARRLHLAPTEGIAPTWLRRQRQQVRALFGEVLADNALRRTGLDPFRWTQTERST